jgi:hypothetical protein
MGVVVRKLSLYLESNPDHTTHPQSLYSLSSFQETGLKRCIRYRAPNFRMNHCISMVNIIYICQCGKSFSHIYHPPPKVFCSIILVHECMLL